MVPNVFEPEFCRTLIDIHAGSAAAPNGEGGPAEAMIADGERQSEIASRFAERLYPEIAKAFHFHPVRIERFLIAAFGREATAHCHPRREADFAGGDGRRFAIALALNSEDHEGGNLRFPEFGSRLFRAPTGGALVFSASLLHEMTPVLTGCRYAFLPLIADEAPAAPRRHDQRRD
jgi:hypothetical protein